MLAGGRESREKARQREKKKTMNWSPSSKGVKIECTSSAKKGPRDLNVYTKEVKQRENKTWDPLVEVLLPALPFVYISDYILLSAGLINWGINVTFQGNGDRIRDYLFDVRYYALILFLICETQNRAQVLTRVLHISLIHEGFFWDVLLNQYKRLTWCWNEGILWWNIVQLWYSNFAEWAERNIRNAVKHGAFGGVLEGGRIFCIWTNSILDSRTVFLCLTKWPAAWGSSTVSTNVVHVGLLGSLQEHFLGGSCCWMFLCHSRG